MTNTDKNDNAINIHDYVLHGRCVFRVTKIKHDTFFFNIELSNSHWASACHLEKVSEKEAMYYLLKKGLSKL